MPFVFRFESLLNYRRSLRDECQRALGEAVALRDRFAGQLEQIGESRAEQTAQLRQIGQQAALDVDGARARQFYRTVLEAEMQGLRRQQEVAEHQIDRARQKLVEADRQVRVLERLRERQLREHQTRTNHHAQRELEDAWQGIRQSKEPE